MTALQLAEQICRDVLLMRGPDANSATPFRMTTEVIPQARLALAKRFARMVPRGASMDDVPRIAAGIAPLLAVGR